MTLRTEQMKLTINSIRCHAYHGCLEEEKRTGGDFLVNVEFEFDGSSAISSDTLSDTIDYVKVHEIVRGQMDIPSKLIEHVAGRILKALRSEFEYAEVITIELTKLHPPVNGGAGSATVSITG
jgi:dihydroneopterin aldolase